MKNILGLIVEYNPFHYGHLHHLQASKKKTHADLVIAVMSGSFLQRGEPACASKWARARMALFGGADLVIELPYIYSTQKAELFATGSVAILAEMGVNQLCFGSESGDIQIIDKTVHIVNEKEQEIHHLVKRNIKKGQSYPRAFADAFHTLFPDEDILDLSKPNNILGYHYVKAIHELAKTMEPFTIKREKVGYHDPSFLDEEKIASATAIRKGILESKNDLSSIEQYIPTYTKKELENEKERFGCIPNWEHYFPFLQHRILTSSLDELAQIYECEEGLEYRLKKYITKSTSFQHFMEEVKTKRYTWTRIQRLLVHILMSTTKDFMKEHCRPASPPYIRVLGMSKKGREYLSQHKKKMHLPLVTRASEYDHPVLNKDILASQMHTLPFTSKRSLHEEFMAIPIQIQ